MCFVQIVDLQCGRWLRLGNKPGSAELTVCLLRILQQHRGIVGIACPLPPHLPFNPVHESVSLPISPITRIHCFTPNSFLYSFEFYSISTCMYPIVSVLACTLQYQHLHVPYSISTCMYPIVSALVRSQERRQECVRHTEVQSPVFQTCKGHASSALF